jgi:substrate-binding family protein
MSIVQINSWVQLPNQEEGRGHLSKRAAPPERPRSTRGARRRADGRGVRIQRRLRLIVSTATTKAAANANKPVRIAYLSFAVANSYDAPMLAAAQTVAKGNNSTIKVFDANNDPKKQFAQLQTATSSGDYDAIIVQPIFGTGLITGVQDAIAAGKKVVNMDQILGKDMSTDQPQVDGLSGNVVFVPPPSSTPPKEPASTSHPRWPTPIRADADLRACRTRRRVTSNARASSCSIKRGSG